MRKQFQKILGSFFGILGSSIFIIGDIIGVYHSFTKHSIGQGFTAAFLPPFALYRGIEILFHKDKDLFVVEAPRLNTEELSLFSEVWGKAVTDTITQSDLDKFKRIFQSYEDRTGIKFIQAGTLFSNIMKTLLEYDRELMRCLLISTDTKRAVITPKLEELRN